MDWKVVNIPGESKERLGELSEAIDEPMGRIVETLIDDMYEDVMGDPDEPRVRVPDNRQNETDSHGHLRSAMKVGDEHEPEGPPEFKL